jgi:hypothetical protein
MIPRDRQDRLLHTRKMKAIGVYQRPPHVGRRITRIALLVLALMIAIVSLVWFAVL